ncbi:MAG: hypothetical protein ABWY63_14315 [Hyphomicrobiaceae bacterium]
MSTINAESATIETPLLARAPRATEYLRRVRTRPVKRPAGSQAAAFLRNHGLLDDEVRTPDKRLICAEEAKREYGSGWYHEVTFTGRERVTERGRVELSKLKHKA